MAELTTIRFGAGLATTTFMAELATIRLMAQRTTTTLMVVLVTMKHIKGDYIPSTISEFSITTVLNCEILYPILTGILVQIPL